MFKKKSPQSKTTTGASDILTALNQVNLNDLPSILENSKSLSRIPSSEISHYEEISILKLGFLGVILSALFSILFTKSPNSSITYTSLLLISLVSIILSISITVFGLIAFNIGGQIDPFPSYGTGTKYFDLKLMSLRYLLSYLLNEKAVSFMIIFLDLSNIMLASGLIALSEWFVDSIEGLKQTIIFWDWNLTLYGIIISVLFVIFFKSLYNVISYVDKLKDERVQLQGAYNSFVKS